jgi:hypothetical protein
VNRHEGLPVFGDREPWVNAVVRLRRSAGFGLSDDVQPVLTKCVSRATAKAYWRRDWRIVREGKPRGLMYQRKDGRWTVTFTPHVTIDDPTAPASAYAPTQRTRDT